MLCQLSLDDLQTRLIIPFEKFRSGIVNIAMYYGNDNYVGECSVKMEDMMYTDEKETVLQVTEAVLGDM